MSSFSDTLEDALRRAFAVQDPDALRRSVRILEEGYDPVRRLEGDVTLVKQDTTEIKSDASVLKGDVGVLKTDVSVLKSDVGVLKTDVSVLKSDVTVLKSDVRLIAERMEQGFLRFDERFELLQREMDKRFATLERFLALTLTVLAVLMTTYHLLG